MLWILWLLSHEHAVQTFSVPLDEAIAMGSLEDDPLVFYPMLRILLVKTSSLGDIVHNLPVVNDILTHFPDAKIDWVVEGSFAALPALHPRIHRVIPIAIRQWRRNFFSLSTWRAIRQFVSLLRQTSYDIIIDSQGLFKSALVDTLAKKNRQFFDPVLQRGIHGLDRLSSREPLGFIYDHLYSVSWSLPAVVRNRSLCAQVFHYETVQRWNDTQAQEPIDYGLSIPPWPVNVLRPLPEENYCVLLHATSADSKLWPEHYWVDLGQQLRTQGLTCVLPWGNEHEKQRSLRLQSAIADSIVPPQWDLNALTSVLSGARLVVGVDTGLTHLAAALKVPTVGIFCATDPKATGIFGCPRSMHLGGIGKPPILEAVWKASQHCMSLA